MPQHLTYQSLHFFMQKALYFLAGASQSIVALSHFFILSCTESPRILATSPFPVMSCWFVVKTCQVFLLVPFYLVDNHMIYSLKVLTEYVLVSVTSAVTVTIAGIVKEAVTILVLISDSIILSMNLSLSMHISDL